MKSSVLIFTIVFAFLIPCFGIDPIEHLRKTCKLTQNDGILRLDIDVNGDGLNELLLTTIDEYENTHKVVHSDDNRTRWCVYFPTNDPKDYIPMASDKAPLAGTIDIDDQHLFAGKISQLGKCGIVTLKRFKPEKGPVMFYVYAYVLEDGKMVEHLLEKYEDGKVNRIFDQYLIDGKRSVVKLNE